MTDTDLDERLQTVRHAVSRYRVSGERSFSLATYPTDELPVGLNKHDAQTLLSDGISRLSSLQERLYADGTWALLVVFQAMDAGGKDSTIKHVMSGINPQGVTVTSFKAPEQRDRAHDFLWRVSQALPARGMIGVFNRSHYEDVLVPRVHPDTLAASHLPATLTGTKSFWSDRIGDIAAFEAYLGRQGIRVVKFFLNVSEAEQRKRLLARFDTPEKLWKIDPADVAERARWTDYRSAYEAAIAGTATDAAPWYVIPADRKWFARLAVAETIVGTLEALDLRFPEAQPQKLAGLKRAYDALSRE